MVRERHSIIRQHDRECYFSACTWTENYEGIICTVGARGVVAIVPFLLFRLERCFGDFGFLQFSFVGRLL